MRGSLSSRITLRVRPRARQDQRCKISRATTTTRGTSRETSFRIRRRRHAGVDRQTVRRALRHVAPDGYEKKQPRWRMKAIIDAVERHLGRKSVPGATVKAAWILPSANSTKAAQLSLDLDLEDLPPGSWSPMMVLVELDGAMRSEGSRNRGRRSSCIPPLRPALPGCDAALRRPV